MVKLSEITGKKEQKVFTAVTIERRNTHTQTTFTPGDPIATVNVKIKSGETSLQETFILQQCDDVDFPRDASSVFVIGWIRDLRMAIEQDRSSLVVKTTISSDNERNSEAVVSMLMRVTSHQPHGGKREHKCDARISAATSVTDAEKRARQRLIEILRDAYAECESKAREMLPILGGDARTARAPWLFNARQELMTPTN